jgi:hypothetical protein
MIHQLRALASRVRSLFGDRKADRDLDDEIEAHLRLLAERYVRQGMTEAEAEWASRRQFGNVTLLKEVNSLSNKAADRATPGTLKQTNDRHGGLRRAGATLGGDR